METAVMAIPRDEIFKKVQDVLVNALGVDEEEVTPQATLRGDLGAESIDFLDIVFRLEKAFTFKERFNIVIRGEAFNLFNSTQTQDVSKASHGYADAGAAGCPTTGLTPHASTVTCMTPATRFRRGTACAGRSTASALSTTWYRQRTRADWIARSMRASSRR